MHRTKDGRVLTSESRIEPITLGERRLVLESTRDVTDQKKWERRRQLLLSELSHRVGNTLTMLQSLARQTLRTVGEPQAFVEMFAGRLDALARSHNLLAEGRWEGAKRLFKLVWRESGGPPVVAPKKKSLGGALIEESLPDATVRREFAPEGLCCGIEFELPEDFADGTENGA